MKISHTISSVIGYITVLILVIHISNCYNLCAHPEQSVLYCI